MVRTTPPDPPPREAPPEAPRSRSRAPAVDSAGRGSAGRPACSDWDEDEDEGGRESRRHVSFKPDSTVDSLEEDFGLKRSPKLASDNDLFHEPAVISSAIELHETDEEKEAEVLRNEDSDLFSDVTPKKVDQGDDI